MSASNGDRIPSRLSEEVGKRLTEQMGHDNFRNKVKEIFGDFIDTVPFMDKVCEYASREIDKRLFNSFKYWATMVGAVVVTSVITVLITNALSH